MDKKRGVFFTGLFLIVFLSLVVSAADYCDVQPSCAPENTVLKLSGTTNAHAEVYDGTNYNYFLCCNFTGIHTQDGNNKIFGLSFSTNAHAEIPSLSNYATNVYFGNLECASDTDACPIGYNIPMLSLSSTTNAHVAQFDYYPVRVCCRQRCTPDCTGRECGDDGCGGTCPPGCDGGAGEICSFNGRCVSEEIYWGSANDPRYAISYLEVVPGVTQVALVLKGIDPPEGTTSFEIFEDGIIDTQDIRTGSDALSAEIDNLGTSIAYWTITQEDIDNAQRLEDPWDLDNFYFSANSKSSNDLAISISGGSCISINDCIKYETEDRCIQDTCLVATTSVGVINEDITCGEGYACNCFWNTTINQCGAGWESVNKSLGVEYDTSSLGIGICNYNENTNDDCDDGFLTYSWVAAIDWPSDNTGWGTQTECIDAGGDALSCVFFDSLIEPGFDDLWHFDPLFNGINSLLTECFGGSSTLQCPAKVQLSFFTFKNFVIVAVILILGYIIYNQQKSKKKKSSKRKSGKKKNR